MLSWIRLPGHPSPQPGADWSLLRLIIFTEYEDTARYLRTQLEAAFAGTAIALKGKRKNGGVPASPVISLEQLLAIPAKARAKWLKENADTELTGETDKRLKAAATVDDLLVALEKRIDRHATPAPVAQGGLVLQPTDERRRSGSHYTPCSPSGSPPWPRTIPSPSSTTPSAVAIPSSASPAGKSKPSPGKPGSPPASSGNRKSANGDCPLRNAVEGPRNNSRSSSRCSASERKIIKLAKERTDPLHVR